jgi:endonuclease G
MAPAADMKWSKQVMQESFYMTNMCPQNHSINAGDWKDLERLVAT